MKQKRRFQKGGALALSLLLLLGSLAGCGGKPQEDASSADGPTNTYMPPVNEDGQIVITMPKTLLGGKTAEELEAADKEQSQTAAQEGTLERAVYNALLANEDGTFSYYLTEEQYPKLKAAYYWLGCLRDPYTTEISWEFVAAADYTDLDENNVPWGLTVSVDAETYYSMEMWYSANLICYWYTKNDMTGKWVYQGTCIGYGIPYSASITAPESPQNAYANGSYHTVLPLAEPNGLYTDGLSTSATWILTTDANGNITPTYVESEITISQYKMDIRLCEDWSIPSDY